jgi:hypothetical protein
MTKRTVIERLNESSYATSKQTKKQKLNQKSPYNQNQVRPDDKENTDRAFKRIKLCNKQTNKQKNRTNKQINKQKLT